MDVGPNLGALNRAALVAADLVVVPLAPDLYSLQGLRNLGPTLRDWQREWQERRERNACYRDFLALANTVRRRAGPHLREMERRSSQQSASSAHRADPATMTFRLLGPAPEPPPPDKLLTPTRMADLAVGLEETIAKIREWGIDVPGRSRLPETARHPRQVATAQSFPESRGGWPVAVV